MIPVFAIGDACTALRLLPGRAMLVSHAYLGSSFVPWDAVPKLAAASPELWCDSGAFTYWQRALKGKPGAGITVETWAQFIVEHAATFAWFVALDVIGDAAATLANWSRLLDLVPAALHAKLVPVWHEGDPAEHLDAYDPNARLVAIGRTDGRKAGAEGRRLTFQFYDSAFNAYPDGRYHMLGNSTPDTIQPYPARSFDATTWQRDSAYAQSHGWPWSSVTKDTRMRAYIEAIETIQHIPREKPRQQAWSWAEAKA